MVQQKIHATKMNTDPQELTLRKDMAVAIAKTAGETILELYAPEITVTQKDNNTPLTDADLAANKFIIDQLDCIDPELPVCTEESCDAFNEERKSWRPYWLVDPLDGTREFINQNGEFSVNIALIHNGKPILGVVHAPVLDITYWATQGGGAWKQTGEDEARKINVRTVTDEQITVAIGWATQLSPELERFLDNLGEYQELRMGGALKSCLVAEGRADVYPCFGPTGEWDTAAAQCIVEEAGGKMIDKQLNTLTYNTRDSLINPDFFAHGISDRCWLDYL